MERRGIDRIVSILVVGMFLSVIVPQNVLAVSYWYPEIFDGDEFVTQGSVIERFSGENAVIIAAERDSSTWYTLDSIYIEIELYDRYNTLVYYADGQTNETEVGSDFFCVRFTIDSSLINVGLYTIQLSAVLPNETKQSTYSMDIIEGGSYERAVPKSILFDTKLMEVNREVGCIIDVTSDVLFMSLTNDVRAFNMEFGKDELWRATVFFGEEGYNDFDIEIIDIEGHSYVFTYDVYVPSRGISIDVPIVRVEKSGGYYTTVVISDLWIDTSVYIDGITWHVNIQHDDNVVVDLSIAEPQSYVRNVWFYRYSTKEIQVIVSGVEEGVAVTYVLSNENMKVSKIFSSVKIKSVNDWRNLWGLLGKGQLLTEETALKSYMVYNVNYDGVFGVYTSERTLVARY